MATKTRSKPDPYQQMAQELQKNVEKQPNYQESMDIHQKLEKLFEKPRHTVRTLAFWHWDEDQSTHVVDTPLTYPDGTTVAAVITKYAQEQSLLVQASFTTTEQPTTRGTIEQIAGITGCEYHTYRNMNGKHHHVTFKVCPDPDLLAEAVQQVTQAAATIAALLHVHQMNDKETG